MMWSNQAFGLISDVKEKEFRQAIPSYYSFEGRSVELSQQEYADCFGRVGLRHKLLSQDHFPEHKRHTRMRQPQLLCHLLFPHGFPALRHDVICFCLGFGFCAHSRRNANSQPWYWGPKPGALLDVEQHLCLSYNMCLWWKARKRLWSASKPKTLQEFQLTCNLSDLPGYYQVPINWSTTPSSSCCHDVK